MQQKSTPSAQEIPDNVTAELEKFEDENVAMGEVEGVGDILSNLGEDDDDDLLNSLTAEMGADFNILEYADPELDALNEGDQANLLDSLDFEDPDAEKDKAKKAALEKLVKNNENKALAAMQLKAGGNAPGGSAAPSNANEPMIENRLQQRLISVGQTSGEMAQNPSVNVNRNPNLQTPPTSMAQAQQMMKQHQLQQHQQQMRQMGQPQVVEGSGMGQPHPHLAQIQQQMLHQVQQAAAMGKPMPIGTQLLSKDGAVGIVVENNNVKVNYQPMYNRNK